MPKSRVQEKGGWSGLTVSPAVARQLAELEDRCRRAPAGGQRRGVRVLFAGPDGTGKALAAGVLAARLGKDLQRVDLAGVASRYIGETEKNLRRVFDAAEAGGAVLFFDEADALFGRRTDVRDSHDRFANLDTGYLLQMIEAHAAIAILGSNRRANLDPAFIRRLDAVVEFPLPRPAGGER
jgi:SpoVK/Ycf46/Vps4 family AAA+-type ATPase